MAADADSAQLWSRYTPIVINFHVSCFIHLLSIENMYCNATTSRETTIIAAKCFGLWTFFICKKYSLYFLQLKKVHGPKRFLQLKKFHELKRFLQLTKVHGSKRFAVHGIKLQQEWSCSIMDMITNIYSITSRDLYINYYTTQESLAQKPCRYHIWWIPSSLSQLFTLASASGLKN